MTLLVQSSKTAYRIMLLFYILINFFTYTTIISISSFRFKKCVLQTLWPWIIFHLFFFYKIFFDTLVFCHTNSCVRGKEFLIKSNGTKKLPWKKVHVHCITLVHGLRTPNEGIHQRYLKNCANVSDKICFGCCLQIWE